MATIRCGTVQFQTIQAVIFDKDGTLADSQNFLRALGQKRARLIDAQIPGVQDPLLMAFGFEVHELNPAGLLAVGSRLENEIAAAAYVAKTGRDWVESLHIVRSAFAEAEQVLGPKTKNTPLFDGALEVLKSLVNAEVKIGILSSDTTQNVLNFIHEYELTTFVQLAMGSDLGSSKPNPDFLAQACEQLAIPHTQVLVIGDSAADIEMGRAMSVAGCVGVSWGWTKPVCLSGVDSMIRDFTEIQIAS